MSFLPLDMDYLTEEMLKKAEIELGETNERRKETLEELRNFVQSDKNLHCSTEDRYLIQFLRPKKFNVKKAITLFQNYYTMKKVRKDVFGRKNFDYLVKACKDNFFCAMPYRDEEGAVIVLIQGKNWNYRDTPFIDIVHSAITLAVGLVDLHPATQVCGIKIIIDVKDFTMQHFLHMPPKVIHAAAKAVTLCAPARLKAFHVINESSVIKHVWNMVKFVLSEKIKNRVHFHSTNLKNLINKINPSLIPEEIGGTLKYDNSHFVKLIQLQEQKYVELTGYGYRSHKCK